MVKTTPEREAIDAYMAGLERDAASGGLRPNPLHWY
jgi:hypothetical protein